METKNRISYCPFASGIGDRGSLIGKSGGRCKGSPHGGQDNSV
jgi:hypothetical protein